MIQIKNVVSNIESDEIQHQNLVDLLEFVSSPLLFVGRKHNELFE